MIKVDGESIGAFSSFGERVSGFAVDEDDRTRSNVNVDFAERGQQLSLTLSVRLDQLIIRIYSIVLWRRDVATCLPLQWSSLSR